MQIRKGILCNLGVMILLIALHAQKELILSVIIILVIQVFIDDILEQIAKRNKSLSANNRENTLNSLKIELFQAQRNLAATIKINEDSEARGEQEFLTEEMELEVERIKASIQELEAMPAHNLKTQKPEPVALPEKQEFYSQWHANYFDYRQAIEQSEIIAKQFDWNDKDIEDAYNRGEIDVWKNRDDDRIEIWQVCTPNYQKCLLVPTSRVRHYNSKVGQWKNAINLISEDELRRITRLIRESRPKYSSTVVK